MADYTCGLYLKHLLSIPPHVDKVMWLLTVRELHEGRFIFLSEGHNCPSYYIYKTLAFCNT